MYIKSGIQNVCGGTYLYSSFSPKIFVFLDELIKINTLNLNHKL